MALLSLSPVPIENVIIFMSSLDKERRLPDPGFRDQNISCLWATHGTWVSPRRSRRCPRNGDKDVHEMLFVIVKSGKPLECSPKGSEFLVDGVSLQWTLLQHFK